MYESNEFEACGYKWKLIIYPNGDDRIEGNDYISVYLAIANDSSLPGGWEANAVFSFFLFNRLCDNYLVIRGQVRRFHKVKSKWGFSKFISHKALKEQSNGYLVDDSIIIGAEVFVVKSQGVGECVSMLEDIETNKHEWKISEFSKLGDSCYLKSLLLGITNGMSLMSEADSGFKFYRFSCTWKILLRPNSCVCQRDQSISIYLILVDAEGFGCRKRVKVEYTLFVKDQINGEHHKKDFSSWFSAVSDSLGLHAFMPQHELKDPKRGFLVKDCCIVEADVSIIGVVNGLT
ncbi:PREDICTED: uncharacterized protein LOC109235877 [Nicotiana attenuata]|uniref:Ubiquitin carboxyl-terminal hydrolase 12 n=1 Tax=Nicotiana attenuata TaxID=49451 RepID=A0A1J6HSD5_NICAT|nr:PREDICTED: uncharacterized protein LOC109235877 [Nicotiana attenuata]OIS95820.1 ubiquitin carboxyl-terminal hydrolase 12 [Nicotiana attenuata]